jgi:hypothetical protein
MGGKAEKSSYISLLNVPLVVGCYPRHMEFFFFFIWNYERFPFTYLLVELLFWNVFVILLKYSKSSRSWIARKATFPMTGMLKST